MYYCTDTMYMGGSMILDKIEAKQEQCSMSIDEAIWQSVKNYCDYELKVECSSCIYLECCVVDNDPYPVCLKGRVIPYTEPECNIWDNGVEL